MIFLSNGKMPFLDRHTIETDSDQGYCSYKSNLLMQGARDGRAGAATLASAPDAAPSAGIARTEAQTVRGLFVPVESSLLQALDGAGIAWSLHEHEAVFTVEASAALHAAIAGHHTKNLFLKDAGGQFWIVTAPHDASIDLKALPEAIGSKKVSFGKAEDMERLLGVSPGSVTPLAAFNDTDGQVRVVLDQRLAGAETVNVHPLRNTATLGLSGTDLVAFLSGIGHAPVIAALPARA
jgi:Ala-tRNA(Pro) deacylase